jgi:hypothetical protein
MLRSGLVSSLSDATHALYYQSLKDSEVAIYRSPDHDGITFVIRATGTKLIKVEWTDLLGEKKSGYIEPGQHLAVTTRSYSEPPTVLELNNGL